MHLSKKKKISLSLLLVAVFVSGLALSLSATITITGRDTITTLGIPVMLEAKAERKLISFLAPDVKKLAVTFLLEGNIIGTAISDKEGIARLEYRPKGEGIYTISYQIAKGKMKFRAGRLFVVYPKKPAFVVDLDGTISNLPDWEVPISGATAPTFPHAPELLAKLAVNYQIIYLTARDDALDAISLAFLSKHKFPQGPVIYNDLGLSAGKREQLLPKHHGAFKLAKIKEMQSRRVAIVAGIGNSATDQEAYVAAGIVAYLRNDPKYKLGDPAIVFDNYQDLEKVIAEHEMQGKLLPQAKDAEKKF